MDSERLKAIGNEVARQVTAKTGVDNISFVIVSGADKESIGIRGVIAQAGRQGAYAINKEQAHMLLDAPEAEVRAFLQDYLAYVAHSVLASDDQVQDSGYRTYDEQDSKG
jgi:hypothetical protein